MKAETSAAMSASRIEDSEAVMFSIAFSFARMLKARRFWKAPRSPRCWATFVIARSTLVIVP